MSSLSRSNALKPGGEAGHGEEQAGGQPPSDPSVSDVKGGFMGKARREEEARREQPVTADVPAAPQQPSRVVPERRKTAELLGQLRAINAATRVSVRSLLSKQGVAQA
jgi:hypothetical protein